MTAKIRLHATAKSGHCHRVELFLRILDVGYELVDASQPVRQTEAFAALNPLRQIPVLEDGDLVIPDSNAILVYLAKRYDATGAWLPEDPFGAAQVQRWLSLAAGEVRYGPAAARAAILFNMPADRETTRQTAERLFAFLEQHLATHAYLALERPTLADLACYAYVAHAPEGGLPIEAYPAIRAWLTRIEALPRFKPMPTSAVPA